MFDKDGVLTDFGSDLLEAHWQGMTAHEYAMLSGQDPMVVAEIMDTFEQGGW